MQEEKFISILERGNSTALLIGGNRKKKERENIKRERNN